MAETTTQTGNIYGLSASTLSQGAAIREANEALFDPDRVRASDIVETVAQKADNIYRVSQFNNALQELENRETSFTDEHKKQTREFLESQRDNLVGSLTTGLDDIDKEGAENAEATLDQVAKDLGTWENIIKEIPNIGNGVGFSSGMTPEAEHVITEIAKGENTNLKFGEGGEITYEVTMPDGSALDITKAELETVLEQNIVPKDFMLGQFDRNTNFVTAGEGANNLDEFNYDTEKANNLDIIKPSTNPNAPSLNSLLFDKGHIPGVSKPIAQLILEDPELQNFSYEVTENTEGLDTDGNGVITLADFKAGDYVKLMEAMMHPDNANQTYDMIATLMTNKNQQNFTKGFNSKNEGTTTQGGDTTTQSGDTTTQSGDTTIQGGGGGSTTAQVDQTARTTYDSPELTEDEARFQGDIPAGTGRDTLPRRRRFSRFMRNVFGLPTQRSQDRQASRDFEARKNKQEQDEVISEQLEASWEKTMEEKGFPQDKRYVSRPDNMEVGDMYEVGVIGTGIQDSVTSQLSRARKFNPILDDSETYKPLRKREVRDGKQVEILYFKKIK